MSERVSSGPTRPTTKCGGEVADVGVAPGDEVAAGRGHRLVERLALALAGPQLGQHVVDGEHPSAGVGGDAGGVVGGVVVHHEDLVHQPAAVDQRGADLLDDRADGGAPRRAPGRHTLTTWPWRALSSARAAASKSPCR